MSQIWTRGKTKQLNSAKDLVPGQQIPHLGHHQVPPRLRGSLSLWGQQTCCRGQGQQHEPEGGTRRMDVCSYIGVLLAYLVGMQRLPVGLREGCHLQAERGVSTAPGAPGEGEAGPSPSSPSL